MLFISKLETRCLIFIAGELKGPDMPFDKALLMELVAWFKYKFFSWMDRPDCNICGGVTNLLTTAMKRVESEYCRVEVC